MTRMNIFFVSSRRIQTLPNANLSESLYDHFADLPIEQRDRPHVVAFAPNKPIKNRGDAKVQEDVAALGDLSSGDTAQRIDAYVPLSEVLPMPLNENDVHVILKGLPVTLTIYVKDNETFHVVEIPEITTLNKISSYIKRDSISAVYMLRKTQEYRAARKQEIAKNISQLGEDDLEEQELYHTIGEIFPGAVRRGIVHLIVTAVSQDEEPSLKRQRTSLEDPTKDDLAALSSIHQRWWGHAMSLPKANTIFDIDVNPIPESFERSGRILIREEYLHILQRIEYIYHILPHTGVLVTGQPGIGKTIFLKFLLLYRLSRSLPTLFTFAANTFLFNFQGVALNPSLPRSPDRSQPIWSLIDMDDKIQQPHPQLWRNVFPVQSASPNPHRYSIWIKQKTGTKLYMNAWSDEELKLGLPLHVSEPKQSLYAERNPIQHYGGVPRTIYGALNHSPYRPPSPDLASFNVKTLMEVVGHGRAGEANTFSHSIILIRRPTSYHNGGPSHLGLEQRTASDDCAVDFLSPYVMAKVHEALAVLHFDNIRDLFNLFSPCPETSISAGWLFESFAHRVLSHTGPSKFTVPPLDDESPTESGGRLTRSKAKAIKTRTSALSLPPSHRLIEYESLETLELDFHSSQPVYLVPRQRNNPLFDAVLLDAAGINPRNIFVIQISTAFVHHGSEKGYEKLQALRSIIGGNVLLVWNYVYVYPASNKHQFKKRREWILPAECPDELLGKQYYLELQVDRFIGQSFTSG